MLLNHTSGLPDDDWDFEIAADPDPLEQAVRSLAATKLLHAPGAAWSYSGMGYTVLGDLIAKVSGEPFEAYMQQHLLKPLSMDNSTFVEADVAPDLRASPHVSAEDGSPTLGKPFCDERDAPACTLYSNCEDMIRWAQAMLNDGELNGTRILQPESIEAIWSSQAETPWPDMVGSWYGAPVADYGLGWYVGEKDGHRLVGHAGGGDGYNTQIQLAPDDGIAVIAMDNWLVDATATWYPASFAAIDVLYELLGIENPDIAGE
jgi:CubicO group peptidase (beta-lactamase class C family)